MHDGRTTIVLPCYNEAKRLPVEAVRDYLKLAPPAHLLFIDDGSTDATRQLLLALRAEFPTACSIAALVANCGKAEAVRRGLQLAMDGAAAAVGYWDADLATPLTEIPEFMAVLARRPDVDAVLGSRRRMLGRRVERQPLRALASACSRRVIAGALRAGVYDSQCGAKLFRVTNCLRRTLAWPFSSRWLFDVELLLRMQRFADSGAGRWYEQPLEHWRERPGSKLRAGDYGRSLIDLRRLARTYARLETVRQEEQRGLALPLTQLVELGPSDAVPADRAA
jgi:glycosyltransferase involved in cell wall biosynthesis